MNTQFNRYDVLTQPAWGDLTDEQQLALMELQITYQHLLDRGYDRWRLLANVDEAQL